MNLTQSRKGAPKGIVTRPAKGDCASLACWSGVLVAMLVAPCFAAKHSTWDGALLKPIAREEIYAFTREPAIRKVENDRYEITFASKARCDVAVAIEDASGRIVRHIVYGVLGPNAPEPLKKNSLEQTVIWDGKDEFGKYVRRPEGCRVRVSLGLRPTFDRNIGWHPKDTSDNQNIAAIAADPAGVYVLETLDSGSHQLRKFDHDARYVEALYPWNPDKLEQVDIPKRTLPDGRVWGESEQPPSGSRTVPVMAGYGATHPLMNVQDPTCMAASGGNLYLYTRGGYSDMRRLLRLRIDGTTGSQPITGPFFTKPKQRSFMGQAHMTLSPDSRWIYVTGLGRREGFGNHRELRLEPPPYSWHAVFRFGWDDQGPVVEGRDSLIGEVSRDKKLCGAGSDNQHLDTPQGLACDAAGRLYVADFGNDRIQVFSPDGQHLKTIPVKQPRELAVNQKTGEIYALCFPERLFVRASVVGSLTLIKFGPFEEPVERFRQRIPLIAGDPRYVAFPPIMALDSWSAVPRIWLVHDRGVVRVYSDTDQQLELFEDFEATVRKAGHTPHAMRGGKMGYLAVDQVRGHLYRVKGNRMRINPEEGKTWQVVDVSRIPSSNRKRTDIEDMIGAWDGLLYVRGMRYVARFDPDKFPATGTIELSANCEVPFDYGEARQSSGQGDQVADPDLAGVIWFPWAMGGANGYNNGAAVSPRGDVVVLIENFQNMENFDIKSNLLRARTAEQITEDRYRPKLFPGRHWSHGHLIWRWDRHGRLLGQDILPGLPYSSFGIRTDTAGNLFVGIGYHKNVDGKAHIGGSLGKFAPQGARLIRDFSTKVPLTNVPKSPADFITNKGNRIWGQNMYWAAEGLDQLHLQGGEPSGTGYPCECFHCKFDTDLYGRTFMPRAYAYHVAVLDTNGNRICTIGRYGNADKPAMKPGDTDIGLGQCSYLATVSDRWLYIADDSNLRIIRVRLGYHEQKIVPIGAATK